MTRIYQCTIVYNNMPIDCILDWAYAYPFQDGTVMQSNK